MNDKTLSKYISYFFNDILDVFDEGIYITDSKGTTLKVNNTYEEQTGLKEEELKGRLVQDLVKEKVFDIVLNPQIVKTCKPASCVQTNKRGRKIFLQGYPIFDKKQNVALVVTFARDITTLSQLQEQIDYQRKLIEKYQQNFLNYCKKNNSEVIFESPKMIEKLNTLEKVSQTDVPVLILGETGVGKDIFAQLIHKNSLRNNEPFLKVDCASIPENLIESELFGYAPGAFSGANPKGKPGYFELADKGTLFLDEIGELPLHLQSKLLRVLQDKEIMSIGATKTKKIDVRIIAATNRNLLEEVKEGRFRSDLYFRLCVAVIDIPPLRERKEDILPLADYFMKKFNTKYKKRIILNNDTKNLFLQYYWPGNVRELENLIQSLVVTKDKNYIEICDLPPHMLKEESRINCTSQYMVYFSRGKKLSEIICQIEKNIIKDAIKEFGSVTAAAKHLQIDRSTIFRKLKKSD